MVEDIVVRKAPAFTGAFLEGPTYDEFSDEAFGQVYKRLEQWLARSGLRPGRWISNFYGSPDAPGEQGRSEACVSFEGDRPPSEGVDVKEVPEELVATLTTTLDKVERPEDVYERMYQWIEEEGYSPTGSPFAREIYSVNPWETEASETEVEFQIPVKRSD